MTLEERKDSIVLGFSDDGCFGWDVRAQAHIGNKGPFYPFENRTGFLAEVD